MTLNLSESIAFASIMILTGMTGNAWFLFLTIWPLLLWKTTDDETNNQCNKERHDLNIAKLKEEIRLLEARKK